jgi:PKHD-type hydroxylase
MSLYQLLPSADVACKEETHAYWENGFSQAEITRIRMMGDRDISATTSNQALIGAGQENPDIRRSKLAWFNLNEETTWLYDKLGYVVRQVNGQYFQFNLTGFAEPFQYTVYNGTERSHYDWHMDKGYADNGAAPRKLSLVLMLSDPDEYEGGELELMTGPQPSKVANTQGLIHLFPSWVLHRVTPVTKGTRRSLVVWVCGPRFR